MEKSKNKDDDIKYNKWCSRRWLITIWSMLLITVLSVLSLIFGNDSFVPLCTTLVAIPVGFVSLESVKKWKMKGEKND